MKLSIIVPTHNRSVLCAKLSNSLPQDEDIEIIFVENGSNKKELKRYSKMPLNNNCYLYHLESGNVSGARNFGIEKSIGEYICFLDDDDELSESGYRILSNFEYKSGINKYCFSWNGQDHKFVWPFFRTGRQNLSPSTWILPRNFLNKHKLRFNKGITYGEDQLFGYEILKLSQKIHYHKEVLIKFNPSNVKISITRGTSLSALRKMRVLKEFANDRNGRIIKNKILRNIRNESKNE